MAQLAQAGQNDVLVNIDKCQQCEGFWFDNQELFSMSQEEAREYDSKTALKYYNRLTGIVLSQM